MRASGAFYTDFLDGFTNVYHNASSLVARLSWPSSRPEAVLLNAHYDSFPGSPPLLTIKPKPKPKPKP